MGIIVPSRRVISGASEVNMVICSATLASQAWRLLISVEEALCITIGLCDKVMNVEAIL